MKKSSNYIFLLMLSILLGSCEKFLDIKYSNTQTPITKVDECQQLMNDFELMNKNYPSDGMFSGEEFYLNDAEYNSSDISVIDRNLFTWNVLSFGVNWTFPYARVYRANIVLESLAKIEKRDGSSDALKNVRGQALFFRAFAFWQLAQLYTKPYSTTTAGSDPGIPLRLSSDINDKSVRGTVQQTYDRILQDLNEAVSLLDPSFSVPTRPTKAAAYAMLARVYLGMEDYPKALTNASEALTLNNQLMDFNTLDSTSETPFPRYNPEMIFYALSTSEGANMIAPNAYAKIAPVLIALYGPNDLRRNVLFNENTSDNSFYFTGNYEQSTWSDFFIGLAVDEVLLTRAECYARAGNTAAAMTDLNKLLESRWNTNGGTTPYIPLTATNADDALTKIILERRKELVFRGMRWTDLRRLNKDTRFAQTLTRVALGVTYTLPPNDPRYTLLIPQEAINMGKIEQNQR